MEYIHNIKFEEWGMRISWGLQILLSVVLFTCTHQLLRAGNGTPAVQRSVVFSPVPTDSTLVELQEHTAELAPLRNAWGLDILVSNDGFGLGTFYRREFTEDLFGFAMLSISESKDDREFEQYDPYYYYNGRTYVPGKLNRFLVMPLTLGIQRRLFREDIADNFRPFINAGAGPTMILSAPFAELSKSPTGLIQVNQIEFFKSLGRGQAHYTLSAFIGAGANFGSEKSNVFGVNFRYYFTYLLGDGLPSLYNPATGELAARKKDFGGFFITLNVGMAY
jgi:hypothetical protein